MAAALAEIGGAYLVWVGLRDDKGPYVVFLGVIALAATMLEPAVPEPELAEVPDTAIDDSRTPYQEAA